MKKKTGCKRSEKTGVPCDKPKTDDTVDKLKEIAVVECGLKRCKCGKADCEFGEDFEGDGRSGKPIYRNTARYKMIDEGDECSDTSKS